MIGAFGRGAGIACIRLAIVPIQKKKLDENRLEHPVIRDASSSIDRVLKIFDRDEFGTISPEASFVNVFTFTGAFTGAFYGGLLHSRIENMNFRESNEATLYYSQKKAQSALMDRTTIGFGKGALRFGIRYAIFFFSFSGLSTVISRFRGKSGVLEYSLAGLFTGSIYKFGLGPKGMIAGGFFGTFLGTFAGLSIYGLTKFSGVPIDELYNTTQLFFKYKDAKFHQAAKTHLEEADLVIDKFYPDGKMDSNHQALDELPDIKDSSELKFNKNVIPKELRESPAEK